MLRPHNTVSFGKIVRKDINGGGHKNENYFRKYSKMKKKAYPLTKMSAAIPKERNKGVPIKHEIFCKIIPSKRPHSIFLTHDKTLLLYVHAKIFFPNETFLIASEIA